MSNEQIIAEAQKLLRDDIPASDGAVQKIYYIWRHDIYKPIPDNDYAVSCIVNFTLVDGEWTFQSLARN